MSRITGKELRCFSDAPVTPEIIQHMPVADGLHRLGSSGNPLLTQCAYFLFDAVGKRTFPSYHTYKCTQDKIKQSAVASNRCFVVEVMGRERGAGGGVEAVGQGFVDEMFRVWKNRHPNTRLHPVNMIPPIAFLVEHGRKAAEISATERRVAPRPPNRR